MKEQIEPPKVRHRFRLGLAEYFDGKIDDEKLQEEIRVAADWLEDHRPEVVPLMAVAILRLASVFDVSTLDSGWGVPYNGILFHFYTRSRNGRASGTLCGRIGSGYRRELVFPLPRNASPVCKTCLKICDSLVRDSEKP